jgi:hypothetical protein
MIKGRDLTFFIRKYISLAPLIMVAGAAMLSLLFCLIYLDTPLLEMHGFRQTQTALTAYWLMENGAVWPYETPVAGYPWAIPMEFPFFQAISATITWMTGLPLDMAGRLLSWIFLMGCFVPIWKITKLFRWPAATAWFFCALLWTHPIYLFWGRAFTIETSTLFFSLMALASGLKLLQKDVSWHGWAAFSVWISIALLQKVTTALPIFFCVCFLLCIAILSRNKIVRPKELLTGLLATIVPAILAIQWTRWTDAEKALNPMQLTSTNLREVYLGTLAQRFDLDILKTIFWDRCLLGSIGSVFYIGLTVAGIVLLKKEEKYTIITAWLIFIFPVFMFINVHHWHNYYQVANAYGILIPASLVLGYLFHNSVGLSKKVLILICFGLLIGVQFIAFYKQYFYSVRGRDWSDHPVLEVAAYIKKNTAPTSSIVIFGADWSSETAYYSQRKAFTVPGWHRDFETIWQNPQYFVGSRPLSAIVFYNDLSQMQGKSPTDHPLVKKENLVYLSKDRVAVYLVNDDINSK